VKTVRNMSSGAACLCAGQGLTRKYSILILILILILSPSQANK